MLNFFKKKKVTPKREGCTLKGPCNPIINPGLGGIECERCGFFENLEQFRN